MDRPLVLGGDSEILRQTIRHVKQTAGCDSPLHGPVVSLS